MYLFGQNIAPSGASISISSLNYSDSSVGYLSFWPDRQLLSSLEIKE